MFLKTLDKKQKNNLKNLNEILKSWLALRFTWQNEPYYMDMKFERKFLYQFSLLKVITQKTKFNIECLTPNMVKN